MTVQLDSEKYSETEDRETECPQRAGGKKEKKMKKLMILIALLAIAGMAQADIVDGTMDGPMADAADSLMQAKDLDQDGWSTKSPTGLSLFELSGGVMQRSTDLSRDTYGFGQIITGNGTDDGSWIKFDVSYNFDGTDGEQFRVCLVGINDGAALFASGINTRTGPSSGTADIGSFSTADGATINNLYDSGLMQGLTGAQTLNVDMAVSGTGYDYYAFFVLSDDINGTVAGDTFTVDNVSIVPSSGPAGTPGTLFVIK